MEVFQWLAFLGQMGFATVYLAIGGVALIIMLAGLVLDGLMDMMDFLPFLEDTPAGNGAGFLGLIAGVGFGGAVGMSLLGLGPVGALIPGLGTGMLLMFVLGGIYKSLRRDTADSSYQADVLVGMEVVVSQTIPSDGVGEIMVEIRGQSRWHTARHETGKEVNQGQLVEVVSASSGAMFVR